MTAEYQPARAWFITSLLALYMFVNFVDKIVVGLVAVPMMNDLKLTPTEFGVVAGSFFWLFAVGGIVGGFIANKMQAKWLLLISALIWSVAQLPIMYSSSIALIVTARVLLGMGEGPSFGVASHAIYKWFPDKKRNLPIAVINQGSSLGLLIAGVTVPVISATWGWRANFTALAIVGVVWCVLWLLFGKEGRIDAGSNERGKATATTTVGPTPYSVLLRDPTVLSLIAIHFVAYWALSLTLTWLPAYLQKGLGFDGVAAGRLFALVVLINMPIALGLSAWSQRLVGKGATSRTGRGLVGAAAVALAGVLLTLLPMLPLSGMQKVFVVAIATGLISAIYPICFAMMAAVSPVKQRSGMLAIENSIASVAGIIAPVVMGHVIESTQGAAAQGYELGFALSGALLVVGAVVAAVWTNPERTILRLRGRELSASGELAAAH